jgi:hypothetical protein
LHYTKRTFIPSLAEESEVLLLDRGDRIQEVSRSRQLRLKQKWIRSGQKLQYPKLAKDFIMALTGIRKCNGRPKV